MGMNLSLSWVSWVASVLNLYSFGVGAPSTFFLGYILFVKEIVSAFW